jgi:hypothetical protein
MVAVKGLTSNSDFEVTVVGVADPYKKTNAESLMNVTAYAGYSDNGSADLLALTSVQAAHNGNIVQLVAAVPRDQSRRVEVDFDVRCDRDATRLYEELRDLRTGDRVILRRTDGSSRVIKSTASQVSCGTSARRLAGSKASPNVQAIRDTTPPAMEPRACHGQRGTEVAVLCAARVTGMTSRRRNHRPQRAEGLARAHGCPAGAVTIHDHKLRNKECREHVDAPNELCPTVSLGERRCGQDGART